MANINLPAPLALAGGALCLLGGYLVGVVAGPEPSGTTTAEVVRWTSSTDELCLSGDAVADVAQAVDGVLCGVWRRGQGTRDPREGDAFRFVTMTSSRDSADDEATFIFGDVVR